MSDSEWIIEVSARRLHQDQPVYDWQIGTRSGQRYDVWGSSGLMGDPRQGRMPRTPDWVQRIGDPEVPATLDIPSRWSSDGVQMMVIPIADPRPGLAGAMAEADREYQSAASARREVEDRAATSYRILRDGVCRSIRSWATHHQEMTSPLFGHEYAGAVADEATRVILTSGQVTAWLPSATYIGREIVTSRRDAAVWHSTNPDLVAQLARTRRIIEQAARQLDVDPSSLWHA